MASFRPILPKPATQSIEDDLQEKLDEKLIFFDLVSLMRSSICNKTDVEVHEMSNRLSRKEFQRLKDEVVKELQEENILVRLK